MRFTQLRLICLLFLAGWLAIPDAALAQPGGGRRGGFGGGGGGFDSNPSFMLRREDVQGELKLTEEQIKQVTAMQEGMRDNPKFREFFDKLRTAETDEERKLIGIEMQAHTDSELKKILKNEQFGRLQQLSVQRQGSRALENEDTAKQLGLSDGQKTQVKTALEDYDKAREELFRNREMPQEERTAKLEELRLKREAAVDKVLKPEQKKQYEERRGSSFTFDETRSGFGGAGGTQRPGNNTPTARARAVDGAAAGSATVTTDAAAGPATVSFGGSKTDGAPKKLEKLSFNFRFAPWVDVLKLFADSAGLTLDLNDVPQGTFNYHDEREYSPIEALDVINGYLLQKGYLLVRRDEFLVVVNIDSGIPPNLVPTVSIDEMPKRGRNELMRVIIPLVGMTPNEAADEVKELIGPQGKVVAMTRANRIIVTDIGSNLRQIHELLSGLNVEVGDRLFKQFPLKFVDAVDAEMIIRDLFGLPRRGIENVSAGSGSSSNDPRSSSSSRSSSSRSPNSLDPNARVQVAVDERTNTLLITAKTEEMKIIDETLKTIDVDSGTGVVTRGSKVPYLEVYQMKSADAQEVAKTLNVLYPGTVVNEDVRAKRMHVRATGDQHKVIAETIKQLDGEGGSGTQVAVIPLGRMDAYTATASIQSLFVSDGQAAPVVQPHPLGTGLIVRGTGDQVNQIKLLLAQLDPTSTGGAGPGGNVRTVPLGGRNPEEFLKALEQVWNAKGKNPIRTVIPAASGPVRDRKAASDAVPATSAVQDEIMRRTLGVPAGKSVEERTPKDEPAGEAVRPRSTEAKPVSDPKPAVPRPRGLKEDEFKSTATPTSRTGSLLANNKVRAEEFAQFVAYLKDGLDAADEVAQSQDEPETTQPTPKAKTSATDEPKPETSNPETPILVTINGGNLVLMSEDEQALDRLEDVISSLSKAIPPKTQWYVFYLLSADALETATVLERLFPTSSVSTSSSSGGMLGDLTSGISSMGRGLMDMTGLNTLTSGPQTLRIIPDSRTNSLIVSGPSHLVDEVENMLRVLDTSESPEQLSKRTPRYIDVKHAEISEVAEIVRDIYKEEMEPERGAGAQANPLAALMGAAGGGGSSRGGSGRGAAAAQQVRLTVGIDGRSNRLILSCSEPLFKQVEAMVKTIDQSALDSKRTVRVVSLEHVKTAQLKTALGAVMPRVKVTSSRSSSGGGAPAPAAAAPQQSQDDAMRALFLQRMQQQGGGGGGAPGGGGRGGR